MFNTNPLPAPQRNQVRGQLLDQDPPPPDRLPQHSISADHEETGPQVLGIWLLVQALDGTDDVHLVRRDRSATYGTTPDQLSLLCRGDHIRPLFSHEVRTQQRFGNQACAGCLRAAVPDTESPDLVDFYAPLLEAAGWRWSAQVAYGAEPALIFDSQPWLTVVTLPIVGSSTVVSLPNSWSARRPRALGPERFRYLVPAAVAVEWAATTDLNDVSRLDANSQGARR